MSIDVPILPLTEPERLWMEEIYTRNIEGHIFTIRDIWSVLHSRIPSTFRPPAMDPRLITAGGQQIRILGVVALQKEFDILDKIDQVIFWIKNQLLKAPDTDQILADAIAQETKINKDTVSLILQMVTEFGHFYRMSNFDANSTKIKNIEIGGGDDIYYRYIEYPGIRELIILKSYENFRRPIEPFSIIEMKTANEKLEIIIAEIEKLKMGQEAIWTDIRDDISELKALYSLGKKNWRQLLIGKVADMVAAGIISDTLSKAIEEMVKSEVSTFLPL